MVFVLWSSSWETLQQLNSQNFLGLSTPSQKCLNHIGQLKLIFPQGPLVSPSVLPAEDMAEGVGLASSEALWGLLCTETPAHHSSVILIVW